jgi:hypothetical protein
MLTISESSSSSSISSSLDSLSASEYYEEGSSSEPFSYSALVTTLSNLTLFVHILLGSESEECCDVRLDS